MVTKNPEPKAMGRKPFEPTEAQRRQVKAMAAYGIPDYDIAKVIGVSPPTMRKYFFEELDVGHVTATAKVAETLFKMATNADHPKAAICAMFWLKCRSGWKEFPDAPGKKEQAADAARTADHGTEWESLLN